MIFALLKPWVACTAWVITWPTEYASATSAFTSEGVPPYFAMYSLTICMLAAFGDPPYHPFGTKIPFSLPLPTALTNAAPWSGPAVAMKIFGL